MGAGLTKPRAKGMPETRKREASKGEAFQDCWRSIAWGKRCLLYFRKNQNMAITDYGRGALGSQDEATSHCQQRRHPKQRPLHSSRPQIYARKLQMV
jgi:hypothetical protein